MSPEEKKNLRNVAIALSLTSIIGGAIVKYDKEIYSAGIKLPTYSHIIKPIKSNRPLTSTEITDLSKSNVEVRSHGLNLKKDGSCES